MKANAPERIWIDLATDLSKLSGHIDKDSVEYIRKDAFIEKACAWLEKHATSYIITTKIHGCNMTGLHVSFNEDFRKAMEEAIKL